MTDKEGLGVKQFYYFGCTDGPGHYLNAADGSPRLRYNGTPWGSALDGGLLDKSKPQVQGEAKLHHKSGWTAIAFWDRSVDGRSGSNSAFLTNSVEDFGTMVDLASEHFPRVMKRFTFEIRQALSEHPQ